MLLPFPRSKALFEAGRVGSWNTASQFPLESSAAALAAAASTALLDPLASAAAALPTNDSDWAADGAYDELAALMDEEEQTAGTAGAPAPAAEAPAPADSAVPGAPCNATVLDLLASHKSLSTLVALIRTAGGCWASGWVGGLRGMESAQLSWSAALRSHTHAT